MRYSVKKKIIKYSNKKNKLFECLNTIAEEKRINDETKSQVIFLTNEVWQTWVSIFRTFWLVCYFGGVTISKNIDKNFLDIANFSLKDDEATALMKIAKMNRPFTAYNEKLWGAKNILENISSNYINIEEISDILAYISMYGDYIEDLRRIRNSMIHLTGNGFLELKSYMVSRNYHSPSQYYQHNHPINFFYYKIGTSDNFAYEDIFNELDSMIIDVLA